MNAIIPTEGSGSRPWVAMAVEALRGIGRRHVIAAVLLGSALFVAEAISYSTMLFFSAKYISIPVLLANMVVTDQVRAFSLMVAVVIADHAVDLGASRLRAYVAAAVGGGLLGIFLDTIVSWPILQWHLSTAFTLEWHMSKARPEGWLHGKQGLLFGLVTNVTHWLPIAGAIVFFYADRRTARRTEARLQAAERDRIRASRTALESRLQAMQARVEPQFLFNTLAQVERLFRLDPPTAARMLDDLIAYLRAAMPLMRDTSSTVAQEVDLVRAYLDIVRLRLGERLEVSIDVPSEVGEARMPPMMLLPLVDHAIAHGPERSRAGGRLSFGIETSGARVRLSVVDSGAGFLPDRGDDRIVAIRARLAALYGDGATLTLRRRDADASEAVLDFPLERAEAA